MNLDPDLPEVGRLAWLARRLNHVNATLRSLQPINTPDELISHSALGVTRRVKPKGGADTADEDSGARWA